MVYFRKKGALDSSLPRASPQFVGVKALPGATRDNHDNPWADLPTAVILQRVLKLSVKGPIFSTQASGITMACGMTILDLQVLPLSIFGDISDRLDSQNPIA